MPSALSNYLPTSPSDYLELGCIFVLVYAVLRLVRGTIAGAILRGAVVMILLGFMALAFLLRVAELQVLEKILEVSLATLLVALIIVFQPELRRGLLSLGEHNFFDRFRPQPRSCAKDLQRAIENLARERHGALFALERRNALNHIVSTGVTMDAEATAELLSAVFWPGAPLHDGGVVIRGDRIVAAGCIFPLADRRDLAARVGTRHRAGLGLSEESDAVIVIVSEETGIVSIAVSGDLRELDSPADAAGVIEELLGAPVDEPVDLGEVTGEVNVDMPKAPEADSGDDEEEAGS